MSKQSFGVLGSRDQRTKMLGSWFERCFYFSEQCFILLPHPVVGPHNIVILHHMYNNFREIDAFHQCFLVLFFYISLTINFTFRTSHFLCFWTISHLFRTCQMKTFL